MLNGALSARALGEVVMLSPAATTEAVQRLVRARRLTRGVDPEDRRRALISVDPDTAAGIAAMYGGVHTAGMEVIDRYTDDELAAIADFLDRGREMQLRQAERIGREYGTPTRR